MSNVQKVVEDVLALRRLTRSTKMQTTRTQSQLLQTLTATELVEAAKLLEQKEGQDGDRN